MTGLDTEWRVHGDIRRLEISILNAWFEMQVHGDIRRLEKITYQA